MEMVTVTVCYLEMLAHSRRSVMPPQENMEVVHIANPTVPYYRSLYNAIGEPYRWLSRRKMTDEQLAAVLSNPQMEMHVLHVGGIAAGFAELDRRHPDEIELVQFGLIPEFIGRGFGKWFLQWTIDKAWSYHPSRLWLHTCTLDHPAALPNYLKAGFVPFKEQLIQREH